MKDASGVNAGIARSGCFVKDEARAKREGKFEYVAEQSIRAFCDLR